MRILLTLTFIGILGIFVNGQEKREKSYLQLSFDIQNKNICIGDSIDVVAKLTNIYKNPVVVDDNQIGSIKIFDRLINGKIDQYKSFGTQQMSPHHSKPNFVILQPKETYKKNLNFIFDNEYFVKAGKYQMQIGYQQRKDEKFESFNVWQGTVFSNKILISTNQCAK